MTESITPKSHSTIEDVTQHKRLMELVEAEDAANGEVGCGRNWGDKPSVYLSTCGINISDEKFRILMREHLGHLLMERDFDSITTQVSRLIESVVVQAIAPSEGQQQPPVPSEQVVEHIPTAELGQFFREELAFCSETALEQIVQFTHQVIHKAVLHPRHTWSKPIWVLTTVEKVYIAQASVLEDAIAVVKAQYTQETGTLEVVTVGGVLAPEQVISLDRANLLQRADCNPGISH